MLSLAKAAKDYYLQKLGEVSPREDYYLRGGTATGTWRGGGAAELGLRGVVSAKGLVRLFDGQHPTTGEQLGRRIRKDGVAAWDLTFSADKSVSLLWALGDAETRQQVLAAFDEATGAALSYLESVASSTRGASRTPVLDEAGEPVTNDDGTPRCRVETWPIRTTGYVAAWFTEFTSRADDPQLHTHVVVGNRVKGVDGVWRALDGRLLYTHRLAAGYLHEAVVRRQLTERLGVRWQPVEKGMADIEGFTRDQIMAFSQRRQEIKAWGQAKGLADAPAENRAAAIATRSPKRDHPLDELLPTWRARGAEVGLTPEAIAQVMGHSHQITRPDPDRLAERLASPQGLTANESTFSRADVIKAITTALPEGGTRDDIEGLADAFLEHREVIVTLPAQRMPAHIDLPAALTGEERQLARHLVDDTWQAPPMRRRDGTFFPGLVHERRYTTAELLATEQRIIERAKAGLGAGRWAVPDALVDQALEDHPALTRGQREMVRQFATSGNSIDIGVGPAGTGKTTVMAVIRTLAAGTDTPIMGTALAARAATGFQTATEIPAATLTRFLGEAQDGGGLPAGAIVVVDEAAMVGTRQLAQLSDVVEEASGKLILIGDHRQLAEIEAGGLFRALAHRLPVAELSENVRQQHEWERTALAELRDGSVARAVGMYNRRSRVIAAATAEDTINRAVQSWYLDLEQEADPSAVLLLAYHNATVARLNAAARALISGSGRLHGSHVDAGGLVLQVGDRVICLKNRSRLGVLNGDLGTIVGVDPQRRVVTVRLDRTGETRTLPHWYLDDGHLDYGYALTGHKAQGATARRVHTVAGHGVDREWAYVTMSRGQQANTIYLVDPEMSHDTCSHLAHQHDTGLSALVCALGQTASQAAALDTGHGPLTVTDDQLDQRREALEAALIANSRVGDRHHATLRGYSGNLAEYLRLRRETEARHRDRFAAVAYDPPAWITDMLGERPVEPRRAEAWDRVVNRALRHRRGWRVDGLDRRLLR